MTKQTNDHLLFDMIDFYMSVIIRNHESRNYKQCLIPPNSLRSLCNQAASVYQQQTSFMSELEKTAVQRAKNSIIDYVDHISDLKDIKFLFYPFCAGNHFLLLVAVWPFLVEEKHTCDNVVGYFVLDSLKSSRGDNDIPNNCGFIFLLNTMQTYMNSGLHDKVKSPGTRIKVGYEEVFGDTKMRRGSMQFPLIIADKDVFFRQNDICNCGMAVIAHFLEFYVHQVHCDYSNGSNAFEKPSNQNPKSEAPNVLIVANNTMLEFNKIWNVNRRALLNQLKKDNDSSKAKTMIKSFTDFILTSLRKDLYITLDELAKLYHSENEKGPIDMPNVISNTLEKICTLQNSDNETDRFWHLKKSGFRFHLMMASLQ